MARYSHVYFGVNQSCHEALFCTVFSFFVQFLEIGLFLEDEKCTLSEYISKTAWLLSSRKADIIWAATETIFLTKFIFSDQRLNLDLSNSAEHYDRRVSLSLNDDFQKSNLRN